MHLVGRVILQLALGAIFVTLGVSAGIAPSFIPALDLVQLSELLRVAGGVLAAALM